MGKPDMAVFARARSRRSAVEEEVRSHIARELHDRVSQTLTVMLLELESFKSAEVAWDDVLRQVTTIQESTRRVLLNLRQLLYDLRDESIDREGFVRSVERLASRFEEQTHITARVSVDGEWPESIPEPAWLNLYSIVEEALANVRRHSGARSVRIVLDGGHNGQVSIHVIDDGRGFDSGAHVNGLGTIGMQERALILGGELNIDAQLSVGTAVRATFPRDLVTLAAAPAPMPPAPLPISMGVEMSV